MMFSRTLMQLPLLFLIIVLSWSASCHDTELESTGNLINENGNDNEHDNHNDASSSVEPEDTPMSLKILKPRHFSQLPQSRIDSEIEYFKRHRQWSQRVIAEMLLNQILGTTLDGVDWHKVNVNDDGQVVSDRSGRKKDSSVGMYQHPHTGEYEYFRKGHNLNWGANLHEEADVVCEWEGITCYEREDNGREDTCWCVTEAEERENYWAQNSDSTWKECIELCRADGGKIGKNQAPLNAITKIILSDYNLVGGMFPDEIVTLKYLEEINLARNHFIGKFPKSLGHLKGLKYLDFSSNDILGIPDNIVPMESLEEFVLNDCKYLKGSLPDVLFQSTNLKVLDVSNNAFNGTIPALIEQLTSLELLELDRNYFTGTIPSQIGLLTSLELLDVGDNEFSGSIPSELTQLQTMEKISLEKNYITGKIPVGIFSETIGIMNLSDNKLTGPIPEEIKNSQMLHTLALSGNRLSGSIPKELLQLTNLRYLNIMDNRLEGKISSDLCNSITPFVSKFHTDHLPDCTQFIACPRGHFHVHGIATETENCAQCPPCHADGLKDKKCKYIGQISCDDGKEIVTGDFDGDGTLSQREVLRIMFMVSEGYNWNINYLSWGDIRNHPDACKLPGISCKDRLVARIDLREAGLCSSYKEPCIQLPSQIGHLHNSLEVIELTNSESSNLNFPLKIPKEIGLLTKLRILNLNMNYIEKMPTEIGLLQNLSILHLNGCGLTGTLLPAIWNLQNLERLDIRENNFAKQRLPKSISNLTKLRELFISRSNFHGTIPTEIGLMTNLQNLEIWANEFSGTIPETMQNLQSLSRIDVFSNQFHGSIEPLSKLPKLEILHLKHNNFDGTIPSNLGVVPRNLSWIDLSENEFLGTIPPSFSSLKHLSHFDLGRNRLFPPIPEGLCKSKTINGGKVNACDQILCPVGTSSKIGFAKAGEVECTPCKNGETTIFLGDTICANPTTADSLELFYNAINGLGFDSHDNIRNIEEEGECDFDGVYCDVNDEVQSIEFSLSNFEFDPDLFQSQIASRMLSK